MERIRTLLIKLKNIELLPNLLIHYNDKLKDLTQAKVFVLLKTIFKRKNSLDSFSQTVDKVINKPCLKN